MMESNSYKEEISVPEIPLSRLHDHKSRQVTEKYAFYDH